MWRLRRLICRLRGHRYRPHVLLYGRHCTRCNASEVRERFAGTLIQAAAARVAALNETGGYEANIEFRAVDELYRNDR